VAMDPALEGAAARVARWDFDANEVTNHYLNTVFGRGLQFELPWPSNPPAHRELVLFVRFTTEQGQKLTSDAKIEVQPPGDTAGFDRQTRRSPPSAHDDAAAQREPRSRLKARRPGGNAPRATRVPATTDSADAAFDGPTRWPIADTAAADDSAEPAVELQVDDEQAPLEASRANRPTWKPYR